MTGHSTTAGRTVRSAVELASLLGLDQPTPQQQAVIEAPLSPALVVAGAGSGKTETMANRVVWLIANGRVAPHEVLGLTFTRKAAGELTKRIGDRIAQLREVLPEPAVEGSVVPADSRVEFDQATVSTYNSFASALFRDNALLIGREPESALLDEASAWQLARRVVTSSTDDRLVGIGGSVDTITGAVLDLSHELSDNVADPATVARYAERFARIAELPYTSGKAKASPYASVTKAVSDVSALVPLLELAQQYALEKRRRGVLEFSDQVALALAVCRRSPATIIDYRQRYRVVLLDEYQDTSVVQTELLSTLFGGHGVMAVGDPHQSIYGWRGASAANLARFAHDFGVRADCTGDEPAARVVAPVALVSRETVRQFALSTSWRNATTILDAANLLVEPLTAASSVAVESLHPRPAAGPGSVAAEYFEDVVQEADGVAHWLQTALTVRTSRGEKRSAAILFRQRRHMSLFAHALSELGVPYRILGIGGLLTTPEIVDLVSALRVIHDPTAGSDLIRLLSGARWAIGPRDLAELASVAGWLSSRDWSQAPLSDEVSRRMHESVAVDDGRSIVDALDFIGGATEGHSRLSAFSAAGLQRLRAAARQLAFFRSRAGLAVPDLVRLVEQELLLDIEVVANETSALGAANLHAFRDALSGFLASDEQATLGSFLGWLARAERNDTMGPRSDDAERGTVQLLTIHGAKGLEWDVVAVPRLVRGELPASSKEGNGWVRFATLPFEFHGDARELPTLGWESCETQAEFDVDLKRFSEALKLRHGGEERRLGYVAVTRARDELLLTGSFWGGQTAARPPSEFLTELAERGLVAPLPIESGFESSPLDARAEVVQWPLDPLGSRRSAVEDAASRVRASVPGADAGVWQRDIDLLLAERAAGRAASATVPLPGRIPASRFKNFVSDPAGMARGLKRPMPERPYRATRLGTRFHEWVEGRFGTGSLSELVDAASGELDSEEQGDDLDAAEFERLKGIFERSRWAGLAPLDVEIEIHLPFDGRTVICKIDAVYPVASEDGARRVEIVDWKTGRAPRDANDLEQKQLQLALYRLAYAQWTGIEPRDIDAVFYYVSDDLVVRPERLFDEAELLKLWRDATAPADS